MAVALTLMACIAVILTSLHNVLPLILTSDPLVVQGVQQVLPIVAVLLIGDGLNAVLAGVIRGCGRQATGVWDHSACFHPAGSMLLDLCSCVHACVILSINEALQDIHCGHQCVSVFDLDTSCTSYQRDGITSQQARYSV